MAKALKVPVKYSLAGIGLGPASGLRNGIRTRLESMAAHNMATAASIQDDDRFQEMKEDELIAILRSLGATESAIASAREGNYAGCRCV